MKILSKLYKIFFHSRMREDETNSKDVWTLVQNEYNKDPKWNAVGGEMSSEDSYALAKMYQALYGSTHTIPSQRLTTHSIFLTTHTLFLSVIGYLLTRYSELWEKWDFWHTFTILAVPFAFIIFLCLIWYSTLKKYDTLNTVLIMVTRGLEARLPAKPLSYIFDTLNNIKGNHNLGSSMRILPLVFIILYLTIFVFVLRL
jgi:hypothetical protein